MLFPCDFLCGFQILRIFTEKITEQVLLFAVNRLRKRLPMRHAHQQRRVNRHHHLFACQFTHDFRPALFPHRDVTERSNRLAEPLLASVRDFHHAEAGRVRDFAAAILHKLQKIVRIIEVWIPNLVTSADEYGIITANSSNFWRSGARRRNLHMLRTKIIKQGEVVDSFGRAVFLHQIFVDFVLYGFF